MRLCFSIYKITVKPLFKVNNYHNTPKTMLKYPAAERNKEPILNVLKSILSQSVPMKSLEIGSGSGQHIAHFAQYFPNIEWQPTDVDDSLFNSISSYINGCRLSNVAEPIKVDVSLPVSQWPNAISSNANNYDAIVCTNVIHISPWKCSIGLFEAAGVLLKDAGLLITYGPYAIDGILQPESNVNFDKGLRDQNPEWGVRDTKDLKELGFRNGLCLTQMHDMPSNNKILVFKK